ncbi:MAG: DNA (cytosine-5-)-methyltransferase, partial [Microcystis wesenbergii Mw_MB_S_20031200_S109]
MWTFIDLFAGIGGFRIALENLGCQCVFSSEIDLHSQKVYLANYGHLPDNQDIRKLEAKTVPDHDILCGG